MIENKTELSVEILRTGDREEFSRLVDTYSRPNYRWGLKMLGIPTDGEEVLQKQARCRMWYANASSGP